MLMADRLIVLATGGPRGWVKNGLVPIAAVLEWIGLRARVET